jgi:hypothetical protein
VSYIDLPCLHFGASFQAAISTVNNDPLHYHNTVFGAVLPGIPDRQ